MTKLQHVRYNGFKLGLRIADSYALQLKDVNSSMSRAGLHAIKGIVHQMRLCESIGVVGINGDTYTH